MSNSESTPAVTSDVPEPIDTDEGDTTDPSIDDILKAIKEIELPPLSPDEPGEDEPPPQFPDNFDKGFTNCGSLQSLSREIPAQSKDDALHWTLFGQLAADADCINRRTTRQNDPVGWYNFYMQAPSTSTRVLGLITQLTQSYPGADRSSERVQILESQIKATVDLTVLEILSLFLSGPQLAKVRVVVEALKKQANQQSLTLFNQKAANASNANFQVKSMTANITHRTLTTRSATQVSDGSVDRQSNLTIRKSGNFGGSCRSPFSTGAGYLDFNTRQSITRMLFWRWTNRDIVFHRGDDTLTLSRSIANRVRAELVRRLGNRIQQNIREINLA
ncbi:hypothetical protein B0F90DRAFT_1928665 [Multifurca ochricompacta]|uniref:Uncharacterized protein n=1 Tax=Multifurca ochricompacta TaxID=376703 RepID=A0AAD4QJG7_9AGAM|nr:hypothetical protein B0F90DRAFT_1928665 [Multifurca ochricompacta]